MDIGGVDDCVNYCRMVCANSQWVITTETEWHHGWHVKADLGWNYTSKHSFVLLIVHLSAA